MFERWDEVELDLRVQATLALDEGAVPVPLLVAFSDDAAIAVVGLRPFGADGLLPALVEVLALLLPVGAHRLALGLPGQTRGAEGAPDDDSGPLLVVATAEAGAEGRVALAGRILPLAHDGSCWQWRDEQAVDLDTEAWEVTRALADLLRARRTIHDDCGELEQLQAQLARCLLLGHEVDLGQATADRLEPARSAVGPARLGPLAE